MERLTPSPGPTDPGGQWPAQVADRIDSVVGVVRDKAVKPATLLARVLVYGPILAAVGLVTVVFVAVAGVRALNEIPGFRDWISLLAVGGLFTLTGLFLLGRARAAARP